MSNTPTFPTLQFEDEKIRYDVAVLRLDTLPIMPLKLWQAPECITDTGFRRITLTQADTNQTHANGLSLEAVYFRRPVVAQLVPGLISFALPNIRSGSDSCHQLHTNIRRFGGEGRRYLCIVSHYDKHKKELLSVSVTETKKKNILFPLPPKATKLKASQSFLSLKLVPPYGIEMRFVGPESSADADPVPTMGGGNSTASTVTYRGKTSKEWKSEYKKQKAMYIRLRNALPKKDKAEDDSSDQDITVSATSAMETRSIIEDTLSILNEDPEPDQDSESEPKRRFDEVTRQGEASKSPDKPDDISGGISSISLNKDEPEMGKLVFSDDE